MLVKITTQCHMGCKHCMEDSLPVGANMSEDTFRKACDFIKRNEFMFVLMSGGEPTDHPQFTEFVGISKSHGLKTVVLSNGLFLKDERRDEILNSGADFQIINDPEYYPVKVEPFSHPAIQVFDTKIMAPLSPFGRAVKNGLSIGRSSPMCFNLRSATRHFRDFKEAVLFIRGHGKMCTPSITVEGDIVAGESRFCSKIGTVESSNMELTNRVVGLRCSNCGLVNNLHDFQKKAIGECDG